jgi:large subunit ribosomal protein L5
MSLLYQVYKDKTLPELMAHFKYKNILQVPKLEKVVINMGLGEAVQNPKIIETAVDELTAISGQKPVVRKAKKSIAAFKIRVGLPIGCSVTLRKERMYDFLTKLIHIAIPRIRDFRGLSPRGFDGHGNYTFGLKEQIIFPEINYDKIDKIRGMNITIVTTAKNDEEARYLLTSLNVPFRK